MKIAWLMDDPGYVGGAELTQAEFAAAAPEGVEVVRMNPGEVSKDVDRAVIHNCYFYPPEDLTFDVPTFKYWHDVGPMLSQEQRAALSNARPIHISPVQAEFMGAEAPTLIPPAIDLAPFRKASQAGHKREGAVCISWWMAPMKAPDAAAEWAEGNGGVDFYGHGPFAPPGNRGHIAYADMPALLARYKTFVHLPRALEPFGRTVAEAWAAGCAVVVNENVGARYWILNDPGKLDTAASDFWEVVCG